MTKSALKPLLYNAAGWVVMAFSNFLVTAPYRASMLGVSITLFIISLIESTINIVDLED